MLKLSKKTEYALMAAKLMAERNHGSVISAKEISDEFKLSFELVSKVMQKLVRSNIISSAQGAKGGYRLLHQPQDISLIDIIKAVEPNYQIAECMRSSDKENDCSYFDCCKIRDPLAEVQKRIDKIFVETKLSHII